MNPLDQDLVHKCLMTIDLHIGHLVLLIDIIMSSKRKKECEALFSCHQKTKVYRRTSLVGYEYIQIPSDICWFDLNY